MSEAAVESLKAEKTQRGEELRTLKAEQEIAARLVRVQLWLVQMLAICVSQVQFGRSWTPMVLRH